ncbi:hypothetical protein RhiJN_04465 [Ceratobasidium sp. AG-Ba]|nr:hypothetical protein RhiJN_04465 [Ceratobasidium sp. AG-Ba]QRW05356.1 hypothetical protein RhiLY_04355 [Ceratobasidium sp. AG-Ba]
MGNICGSTKTINDSPTHHRLGSISDPPPSTANTAATGTTPRQSGQPRPSGQSRPSGHAQKASDTEERERRAKAAEERAKAAAARGTNALNPKQGQLAAKANKPVTNQPYQREEEPLRWD